MLCRRCQGSHSTRRRIVRQSKSAQLCSRCGHLLGPEDMIERVRAKHSQLARVGLVSQRPLLERKSSKRDKS